MNRIITIILGEGNTAYFYKDPGMIMYSLSKYCGYKSTIAWFANNEVKNSEFEEYCNIINLPHSSSKHQNISNVKDFIKNNIKKYDIVMFYNYGSTNYRLAYYCKKYNPNIKVYCKLDMNENGFSHFYENNITRKVKNYFERIKSKYIDIFTVETRYFYEKLKNNKMFSGRLYYLPNGVSTIGVCVDQLDKITKENIIITVGRLGLYEKNNEMLLNVLKNIDINILKNWKVFFIGPMTDEFKVYYDNFFKQYQYLKPYVTAIGNRTDRNDLYKYYARAKIICMTSRTESFGIATIEGMYFGAYPIVTNYGFVVDDITNSGMFGSIARNNDIDDFSSKLEIFMNNSENNSIYNECKLYAREIFHYDRISKLLNRYLNMSR